MSVLQESHKRTVHTLIEALPYIRKFARATMVVRPGGVALASPQLAAGLAQDVALLKLVGMRPVVVLGDEPPPPDGPAVVDLISAQGGTVMELSSGIGPAGRVSLQVVELLPHDVIPVVLAGAGGRGAAVPTADPDVIAGELAAAIGAEKLVFLSDAGGVLEQDGFEQDVVSECDLAYLGALQAAGKIDGELLPKVSAVRRALDGGVRSAHVIDGRVEHAVLLEVLTDAGCGTKITK